MNCSDFQAKLDLYLDGELDAAAAPLAAGHVAGCRGCHGTVTDHQKARALLVAAVTDRVAAVDVSGLWDAIASCLQEPTPVVTSLAAMRARRALENAARAILRRATPARVGAFAAAAAVAMLAFSVFTTGEQTTPPQHASSGVVAQSRPVRIDAMEVGAGHTVSTWIKPRTKTRVIWVANTGYSVSTVSYDR